jgi:hypothetical protein
MTRCQTLCQSYGVVYTPLAAPTTVNVFYSKTLITSKNIFVVTKKRSWYEGLKMQLVKQNIFEGPKSACEPSVMKKGQIVLSKYFLQS